MIDRKELRYRAENKIAGRDMWIDPATVIDLLDCLEKAECDARVYMKEKNDQWQEIQALQAECIKLKAGWDSSHAAYVKAVTTG